MAAPGTDLTGETVLLRHRPITGEGEVLKQSAVDPDQWLVRFVTGELRWVRTDDVMLCES
jgi:hypothetical protein